VLVGQFCLPVSGTVKDTLYFGKAIFDIVFPGASVQENEDGEGYKIDVKEVRANQKITGISITGESLKLSRVQPVLVFGAVRVVIVVLLGGTLVVPKGARIGLQTN